MRRPQLPGDRHRLRLDGVVGQEHLRGDLRKRQVGGEHRQQAQLGGGQGRGARGGRTPGAGELRPAGPRPAERKHRGGDAARGSRRLPEQGPRRPEIEQRKTSAGLCLCTKAQPDGSGPGQRRRAIPGRGRVLAVVRLARLGSRSRAWLSWEQKRERRRAQVRSDAGDHHPGWPHHLPGRLPASGLGSVIKAAVFLLGFSDRDRSRLGGDLGWLRRLRYHRTSVPEGKSSTRPTSS